jgi:hypothetical protein
MAYGKKGYDCVRIWDVSNALVASSEYSFLDGSDEDTRCKYAVSNRTYLHQYT